MNSAYEKKFQEKFVRELEKYKWEAPDFLDGNKRNVTVDTLISHWRGELNRINNDQLEGVPLTDAEFEQVMVRVNQLSNSYEAAKLLAIEDAKGKIDGIYRDANPKVTRKQVTLTIFKKAEVRGGDSSYRIAREVCTSKGSRFDLVLLINGLPLINIEQKRTDKTLRDAFGQFHRYYLKGEYTNNFMAFSQMMVVTSEIDTRYFATPKSANNFNQSFVFRWSDKNNKPITNWQEVIAQFLKIPMAHQMVGDYVVIDEALLEEDRRHMLMRPYQVYALQAIEGAVLGWDNEDQIPHGGFIWHTTGSGKTITSFKTALFLATRAGVDKVVFLVDRRELDSRTSENFKAYAAYEPVSVDDTPDTNQLASQFKSSKRGIVVTTTFKLNSLVNSLVENSDYELAEKKIVFIIDEAHRTTMGTMLGTIKHYFKKNGLFFGFTGTPLFDENNVKGKINEKSEVINTTEKLFGPKLHEYTIDEAIADGNVLAFNIDYMDTGEIGSYELLRQKLVTAILEEQPNQKKRECERMVLSWSEAKVEEEAAKRELLVYQDETHIPRVVEEILATWDTQSKGHQFNAILTVQYKERVIAYYREFKKQLAQSGQHLNVAMTFSFGNENQPDRIEASVEKEMFADYTSFTGVSFEAGNKKSEEAYFADLVERATRGGSGRNPKNIDLVIVANQLLTGYDSKRINTLYVDRPLEQQGLIQAYSRTNRIFGVGKDFGMIINFQYPKWTKEIVKKALKLYGSGGESSRAIVAPYEAAVEQFALLVQKMVTILPDPTRWAEIRHNTEARNSFCEAFKEAARQYNTVCQYYAYVWDDTLFGLKEHTWMQYAGAYKNLVERDPDQLVDNIIIRPLVGKTKLVGSQCITAEHIIELIGTKVRTHNGIQLVDDETLRLIHEEIRELSNMGEDEQAQLLKRFVDEVLVTGQIPDHTTFDEAFEDWKKSQRATEAKKFADDYGVDLDLLLKAVDLYDSRQPDFVPGIDDIMSRLNYEAARIPLAPSLLGHNMKMLETLPKWIKEVTQKYK